MGLGHLGPRPLGYGTACQMKCAWSNPTCNFAGWSMLGMARDVNALFVVPMFNPCYVLLFLLVHFNFACSCLLSDFA